MPEIWYTDCKNGFSKTLSGDQIFDEADPGFIQRLPLVTWAISKFIFAKLKEIG